VPLAHEDRAKTAFSTATGHYEYLRMSFGVKSAPNTFQRLMNQVFMGLLGTKRFVYLDDLILFGESLQEHHEKLRYILERLSQFNLKLRQLSYLGHVVTNEGVKPDPQKIKAIKEIPTPRNTKDVKTF
jgi:hypothetical protein